MVNIFNFNEGLAIYSSWPRTYYIAQDGLKLEHLLPLSLKGWEYRFVIL